MKQYQITRTGCWLIALVLFLITLFFLKVLSVVLRSPLFWIGLAVLYLYNRTKRKPTVDQPVRTSNTTLQQDLIRYEEYEILDEDE